MYKFQLSVELVYKVKVWDKAGNVTEQMLDVSKVNPENCKTVEMYAYTVY